jgi:hypothetical protein
LVHLKTEWAKKLFPCTHQDLSAATSEQNKPALAIWVTQVDNPETNTLQGIDHEGI